jgi:acyl carrier protein
MKRSSSKSTNISQKVYQALGKYLQRAPDKLHPEDSLRDDLGLDSLQTIELIYEVESAFDLQIPDEDFGRLRTIGEVVEYLNERTTPAGPSPSASKDTRSVNHKSPPATKTKTGTRSKKKPKP